MLLIPYAAAADDFLSCNDGYGGRDNPLYGVGLYVAMSGTNTIAPQTSLSLRMGRRECSWFRKGCPWRRDFERVQVLCPLSSGKLTLLDVLGGAEKSS